MKHLILILVFSLPIFMLSQGVGINNTGVAPNANSMLDISSDSKGILITRLTTVARTTLGTALGLPDNGMLVYDKDLLAFYYWDGTIWVQVGSGTGDNWGTQVIQTSGTNITGDGTTGAPLIMTEVDGSITNEIELPIGGTTGQVLSTDGSGVYTWVNDNSGTDNQNIANLAFNNTTNILTVGIVNGTSQTVDLTALLNDADNNPTNEIQDLVIVGNILTITNNGTPTNIDLSSYLDNTDNQDLTLTGNTLAVTNDGTTVDLSGYLDNTDAQNLTSNVVGSNATININGGTSTSFSINDADSDPTNEIELPTGGTTGQVLSTDGSGVYSWMSQIVDTDTHLDSIGVAALGFVAGEHIITFQGFAYYTTGFSKTGGTWENLIINLLSYNTFNGTTYNTTTGEFTAPRTGFYRFNLHGYSPTSVGIGNRYAFGVSVNGVLKSFSGGAFSALDSPLTTFSSVIYLSINDIVTPRMYSAISATIGISTTGHNFWFEGEFVGK